MKKIFYYFLIINLFTLSVKANDTKIFYSGFSFSNTYDSNSRLAGYTSKLITEINKDTGINIISSALIDTIKNSNFKNIELDTENLLDFDKYPDNSIVMSVALQHEEFTQEYSYTSKTFAGFYDAYFQILFYDFSNKNLIASIPYDFEIQILSNQKLSKNQVQDRIKDFYLNDKPFDQLEQRINQFSIKQKYENRIGVTTVTIQEKAFEEMPSSSKKNQNSIKNLIAQTFSKRLSLHHNIAIVPYMEGQSIGNVMKLRFIQTDEVYSIQLPNPDYHIHINLKGFKK